MQTRLSDKLKFADEFKMGFFPWLNPNNYKYLTENKDSHEANTSYKDYIRAKIWDYVAGECFRDFKLGQFNPNTQDKYLASLLFDITNEFRVFFRDEEDQKIQLLAKLFLIKHLMIILAEAQAKLEEENLDPAARENYEYCVQTLERCLYKKSYFLFYENNLATKVKDILASPSILDDNVFEELIESQKNIALSTPAAKTKLGECLLTMVSVHANLDQSNFFYLKYFSTATEFCISEQAKSAWGHLFFRMELKEQKEQKKHEQKDPVSLIEKFYQTLKNQKDEAFAQAAVKSAIYDLRSQQNNAKLSPARKKLLSNAVNKLLLIRKSIVPSGAEKRETESFLDIQIKNCTTAQEVLAIYQKYAENFTINTRRYVLWDEYYPESRIHFITQCQKRFNYLYNPNKHSELDADALFDHSEQNMRGPLISKKNTI